MGNRKAQVMDCGKGKLKVNGIGAWGKHPIGQRNDSTYIESLSPIVDSEVYKNSSITDWNVTAAYQKNVPA
jgi:hypothetical protein